MNESVNTAFQKAVELLKAGNQNGAYTILVSILEQDAEVAQAWYLLAFTLSDAEQKLDCFKQVLRIDPNNQAAQKQIDKLMAAPQVNVFHTPEPTYPAPAPIVETTPYFSQTSGPTPMQAPMKKQSTKPAARLPTWVWIALAAFIAIIFIGLPLLYISNGMETDSQVDALFAQRKCVEVTSYKTFEQSFPEFLFSSLYGVYHQVEECQARLALDDTLKRQDWPSSYNVILNYLTYYPDGAFAAEMREQAGSVLMSWSNNLVAEKDYKTAIEKLELLQRVYPNSSAAPSAQTTIFNDYLFWGKNLFEQKDYPGAEKVLIDVSSSEKASGEQIKQANLGLATVYLQWGKKLIEDGDIEQGVQRYEAAQSLAPDLADYARLKSQAGLMRVDALARENDFDQALAMLKTMSETAVSEEAKADILAGETKVLDSYAHSDGKQAQALMSSTAISMCSQQPPTLPIFGTDPNVSRFAFISPITIQIPDGWGAMRPAELHYSVCIEHTKTRIQTCGPYDGGYMIYRIRYSWTVKLYDITTGKLYRTTKFQGAAPRACKAMELFYVTSPVVEFSGAMPGIEPVLNWLTKLKVHQ